MDVELLVSVVRRVVGASSATLLDWTAEPIAYTRYLPGRRLERIRGHALRDGREVGWSVVLKVGGASREVRAYQSGLLVEFPHELDVTVFDSYIRGLGDGGWTGTREIVRLGFTAAVGLRWSLVAATRTQPSEPLGLLARFVVERAAEAIELSEELRV